MESLPFVIGFIYLAYFKSMEKMSQYVTETGFHNYVFQRIPEYS